MRTRWVFVTVMALTFAGCSSDDGSSTLSTTGDQQQGFPPSEAKAAIASWRSKLVGETISYTADYNCGICAVNGTYAITERDGLVLSIRPIKADKPLHDPPTLTSVLETAAHATGYAYVTESTLTSISLSLDPKKDWIDDEFAYAVRDVTVLSATAHVVIGG